MKKLIIPFVLLLGFLACKKDDPAPISQDFYTCKAQEDPDDLAFDKLWPDWAKTEFYIEEAMYDTIPDSTFIEGLYVGVLKDKNGKHYLGVDSIANKVKPLAGGTTLNIQVYNTKGEHVHGFAAPLSAPKIIYLEDNPEVPKTSCFRAFCALTNNGSNKVVYKGHFDFTY
jgi:hypothetical protein